MTTKFKKGDKVIVLKEGHFQSHIVSIINTVRKFKTKYKYFVDIPGFNSQHFTENELRKV